MKSETFTTSDLDLAALLVTAGVKMLDVTRNGDRKASFVFDDSGGKCHELRRRFVCGDIESNAFELLRNLRGLKYRLHQI